MQKVLQCWRDVTDREYPDFLHMLPLPEEIDIDKLINGGIMTDTCSAAQKTNTLLSEEISGEIHNLLCHNHLRNVWVKNVLESLTEFLRSHLNDNLKEVDSMLWVSPSFISFARVFDKMFSLTANYPKGNWEIFHQCFREPLMPHYGTWNVGHTCPIGQMKYRIFNLISYYVICKNSFFKLIIWNAMSHNQILFFKYNLNNL